MTHTMSELMVMSESELNITIEMTMNPYLKKTSMDKLIHVQPDYATYVTEAGNYSTDIRGPYELEGRLPDELAYNYITILKTVITSEESDDLPDWMLNWFFAHATPRQRCIAYILTMEAK